MPVRSWLRMGILMVLTIAMLQLPRLAAAHDGVDHSDGEQHTDDSLIFDLGGCNRQQQPA